MRSIRGTESLYPVTAQELKAKFQALKMGASVINRGPFEAWRSIDILLYGKKCSIDYTDNITLIEDM